MIELAAGLPAAGVRVAGLEEADAGSLVSAGGLIATCAHVLAGCAPGATVSIEPHAADRAPAGGQPTVEVSHEALLHAWPRLQGWLKGRRKRVQWRPQDLGPELERWLDSSENRAFLLPGSPLDPVRQWLNDNPEELAGAVGSLHPGQ